MQLHGDFAVPPLCLNHAGESNKLDGLRVCQGFTPMNADREFSTRKGTTCNPRVSAAAPKVLFQNLQFVALIGLRTRCMQKVAHCPRDLTAFADHAAHVILGDL